MGNWFRSLNNELENKYSYKHEELKKIVDRIQDFDEKVPEIKSLCGEIIATLNINIDRGTLFAEDNDTNDSIKRIIYEWTEQYRKLTADN